MKSNKTIPCHAWVHVYFCVNRSAIKYNIQTKLLTPERKKLGWHGRGAAGQRRCSWIVASERDHLCLRVHGQPRGQSEDHHRGGNLSYFLVSDTLGCREWTMVTGKIRGRLDPFFFSFFWADLNICRESYISWREIKWLLDSRDNIDSLAWAVSQLMKRWWSLCVATLTHCWIHKSSLLL